MAENNAERRPLTEEEANRITTDLDIFFSTLEVEGLLDQVESYDSSRFDLREKIRLTIVRASIKGAFGILNCYRLQTTPAEYMGGIAVHLLGGFTEETDRLVGQIEEEYGEEEQDSEA